MYDSSRVLALLASVTLLLVTALPARGLVAPAANWTLDDFTAVAGEIESTPSGLLLKPDPTGKLHLAISVDGLDLSRHQILHFDTESKIPLSYFLLWRTVEQGDKLFQYKIPPSVIVQGKTALDMAGRPHWEGRATMVGLGLVVPGKHPVLLREFQLYRPGLAYDASLHLREWTGFLPWQVSDSNFYTGTSGYGRGILPVPLAAVLMALLLLTGLAFHLLRGRRAGTSWAVLGAAVFISWLVVDALWQLRLLERARNTLATYAGKTPYERLMSTADAPVLQLVTDILPLIEGENPRVFITSRSEYNAVLGSYYLAPLNTYRNNRGVKMIGPRFLKAGDYVLLIRPSMLPYDAQRGILRSVNNEEIAAESLYISAAGQLLRLI